MDKEEALRVLKSYEDKLSGILERFEHTSHGIHIHREDDPRFRQLVIELRDFLDDVLGKNSYSTMIVNHFNDGIANFMESPSYRSVESIRGVASSLITRIERNPEILSAGQRVREESLPIQPEPELPEKVTLIWLVRHVPVSFWITAAGLLVAAFVAGIQASRISLVKEIFGLETQQQAATSTTQTEQLRRKQLLSQLRQLYILSHDGISAEMMSGLAPLPKDWVEKQLEARGETWRQDQYY